MKTKNSGDSRSAYVDASLGPRMLGLPSSEIGKLFWGIPFWDMGGIPLSELKHPNLLDETFQPGLT